MLSLGQSRSQDYEYSRVLIFCIIIIDLKIAHFMRFSFFFFFFFFGGGRGLLFVWESAKFQCLKGKIIMSKQIH